MKVGTEIGMSRTPTYVIIWATSMVPVILPPLTSSAEVDEAMATYEVKRKQLAAEHGELPEWAAFTESPQ